jgi:hypothetical protein
LIFFSLFEQILGVIIHGVEEKARRYIEKLSNTKVFFFLVLYYYNLSGDVHNPSKSLTAYPKSIPKVHDIGDDQLKTLYEIDKQPDKKEQIHCKLVRVAKKKPSNFSFLCERTHGERVEDRHSCNRLIFWVMVEREISGF